jgi:hypothetical protein
MKKLAHFLFLIMLFFVALPSCEKEQYVTHEKTTVEGRLLSAADRSPIAYGKVFLLKDAKGDLTSAIWYGRHFFSRDTLVTDANGRFSYIFQHSHDTVYAVAAEADGYFANRNSGGYPYPNWRATGSQRIKRGYKNYFTNPHDEKDYHESNGIVYLPEIRLAPKGWIMFNIENESPAFSDDVMKLGGEGAGGQLTTFNGANVNTQYLRGPLRAGRFVYVGYNVTSQEQFRYYKDSVFIKPQDTVIYQLKY